jgi:hypothetical protein
MLSYANTVLTYSLYNNVVCVTLPVAILARAASVVLEHPPSRSSSSLPTVVLQRVCRATAHRHGAEEEAIRQRLPHRAAAHGCRRDGCRRDRC